MTYGGWSGIGVGASVDRRKRSRVFIDPLTEIPRLERWFADDTHPSAYTIEQYTDELNRAAYRQRFPPLEPKNVQLWFKNHRAKVKRQKLELQSSSIISAGHPHPPPITGSTVAQHCLNGDTVNGNGRILSPYRMETLDSIPKHFGTVD